MIQEVDLWALYIVPDYSVFLCDKHLGVKVPISWSFIPGSTFMPRDFCENSISFWCKGCFLKLEKVLQVREDTKKLEEEISGYIVHWNTVYYQEY